MKRLLLGISMVFCLVLIPGSKSAYADGVGFTWWFYEQTYDVDHVWDAVQCFVCFDSAQFLHHPEAWREDMCSTVKNRNIPGSEQLDVSELRKWFYAFGIHQHKLDDSLLLQNMSGPYIRYCGQFYQRLADQTALYCIQNKRNKALDPKCSEAKIDQPYYSYRAVRCENHCGKLLSQDVIDCMVKEFEDYFNDPIGVSSEKNYPSLLEYGSDPALIKMDLFARKHMAAPFIEKELGGQAHEESMDNRDAGVNGIDEYASFRRHYWLFLGMLASFLSLITTVAILLVNRKKPGNKAE